MTPAHKDGKHWATASVATAGAPTRLRRSPDRSVIDADSRGLAFVTAVVSDNDGVVPRAMHAIRFEITGPAEIVATDNGDPTDMTPFPSPIRKAFNGMTLALVRATPRLPGRITLVARADGLRDGRATIEVR